MEEMSQRNPCPPFDSSPESVPVLTAEEGTASSPGAGQSRPGRKNKAAKEKTGKDNFIWEDDEVELLLTCTADYKTRKIAEGIDWESVRQKYDEILQSYKDNVPSEEEAQKLGKSFKHGINISKEVVMGKLKAVRLKYREAVDDGRRSGHGRVVLLYFELCAQIWGGSPATEQISGGLETGDIGPETSGCQSMTPPLTSTASSTSESSGNGPEAVMSAAHESQQSSGESNCTEKTVKARRDLLDQKLANYRHERLKRKASADQQLLNLAQEDMGLKRKFFEAMEKSEDEHKKNMDRMMENMDKMTNTIASGFTFLQTLLLTSPHPYAGLGESQCRPHVYPPPDGLSTRFSNQRMPPVTPHHPAAHHMQPRMENAAWRQPTRAFWDLPTSSQAGGYTDSESP